jgi:hypothetical protein
MADANTSQVFNPTIVITNAAGNPAQVQGAPVWATSDATVLAVTAAADGMSASAPCVAQGTARLTVTADADLGAGVVTITGVSEDINVTTDPAQQASVITFSLGTPVAKAPATP